MVEYSLIMEFDRKKPRHFKEYPLDRLWRYEYFREYLLALGRGKDYTESIDSFPVQIELDGEWHDCLNQLRSETADGYERHIFIATDQEKRVVLLPRNLAVGEQTKVPSDVMREHQQWGKGRGVEEFVGTIHSHPHSKPFSLERLRRFFKYSGNFSVADMYLLLSKNPSFVIGLAEDEENVFAFRTRETSFTNLGYLLIDKSQSDFKNYWYTRSGLRINGEYVSRINGGEIRNEDLWNITLDIADRHKIAVYRGKPDFSLIRFNPPTIIRA